MTPYYDASGIQLFHGHVLDVLRELPDESVNCCITSPPFYGLRDYGTAQWDGGDSACDHLQPFGKVGYASTLRSDGREHKGPYEGEKALETPFPYKHTCGKCGALRVDKQIGLEETPDLYVEKMVEVFNEVRRVLRSDGTCWANWGDSFCNTDKWGGGRNGNTGKHVVSEDGTVPSWAVRAKKPSFDGLKPKDLIGIPWRVAFALQASGWWLRSDIIWAKNSPMPESVEDRPTRSHEYIFLLSKSEKYHYDHDAIKEPSVSDHPSGNGYKRQSRLSYSDDDGPRGSDKQWQPKSWNGSKFDGQRDLAIHPNVSRKPRGAPVHGNKPGRDDQGAACNRPGQEMRNKRDVWTVNTNPFPEAHFATFPPALIRPCVLAGCPLGGTVLDPFSGAATTALVAKENGRRCIGIELNRDYLDISVRRLSQEVFAFSETVPLS